ncbi:hypothetical protein EVAR_71745_1, partial [Eumeta japonica]
VTNTGKEVLCEIVLLALVLHRPRASYSIQPKMGRFHHTRCRVTDPATAHQQMTSGVLSDKAHLKEDYDPNDCAGCRRKSSFPSNMFDAPKCGDPFGDGEEMYLQGSAIWHPRCGPGPNESGLILNGGSGVEFRMEIYRYRM